MISCAKCGKPSDAVFRQNPKGEDGIWYCRSCAEAPINPEVLEIVDIIVESQKLT